MLYRDVTNNHVQQIEYLFNLNAKQPCLPMLPLPTLMPPTVHPTPVVQPLLPPRAQPTFLPVLITPTITPPRVNPTTTNLLVSSPRVQVLLQKHIPEKIHPNTSIYRENSIPTAPCSVFPQSSSASQWKKCFYIGCIEYFPQQYFSVPRALHIY